MQRAAEIKTLHDRCHHAGYNPWLFPCNICQCDWQYSIIGIRCIFNIAAMSDFRIIKLIIKEDAGSLVFDHPNEAACYIYLQAK